MPTSVANALAAIRQRIADAAARSGRGGDAVTLVAVSKTFPVEVIEEAVAAGQRIFGENKVQEGLDKIPALPGDLEWHLIGHLQSNKIRKALPLFGWIETIDSLERARQVDRVAGELGVRPKILLQVNIGQDDAKFGYTESGLRSDFDALLGLLHLDIRGLMTIPPLEESPDRTRAHFAALRVLRDDLEIRAGRPLPDLSMGMSHDFEIAIEEGATLVRVGSAIFGGRG
jgi:pyridoxal phosphate enzyme (YggS family)